VRLGLALPAAVDLTVLAAGVANSLFTLLAGAPGAAADEARSKAHRLSKRQQHSA
jgi:hypothetical protein